MTRPRRARFAHAVGLLTIWPVRPRPAEETPGEGIANWFPLVGLVCVALPTAGLAAAASVPYLLAGWDPATGIERLSLLAATLVVAAWAMSSRFLHWDGLADVADAMWGGHAPARRLEIARDSSVGAFAVVGTVFVALVTVSALAAVMRLSGYLALGVLVAVPVLGRLAATCAAWFGSPARPDGLGRSVAAKPGAGGVIAVVVALAASAAPWALLVPAHVSAGATAAFWLVGIAAAAVVPHLLSRPFDGVTGDVMGASVILTECAALVTIAALGGLWT